MPRVGYRRMRADESANCVGEDRMDKCWGGICEDCDAHLVLPLSLASQDQLLYYWMVVSLCILKG